MCMLAGRESPYRAAVLLHEGQKPDNRYIFRIYTNALIYLIEPINTSTRNEYFYRLKNSMKQPRHSIKASKFIDSL